MLADVVSGDALVTLGEMHIEFRCAPATGNAGLAVNDDSFHLDMLTGRERGQAEDRPLRVTSGVRQQLRAGVDPVAVDLRETVHGTNEIARVVVRLAIPFGVDVRIAQPI